MAKLARETSQDVPPSETDVPGLLCPSSRVSRECVDQAVQVQPGRHARRDDCGGHRVGWHTRLHRRTPSPGTLESAEPPLFYGPLVLLRLGPGPSPRCSSIPSGTSLPQLPCGLQESLQNM